MGGAACIRRPEFQCLDELGIICRLFWKAFEVGLDFIMLRSDAVKVDRTLLDAAAFVVKSIQRMGCDVGGHSRYGRMHRILSNGPLEPNHPDFAIALESLRDARLMEFALGQLEGTIPVPVLQSLVRKAIQDSPLPQEDLDASAGRDAQAELYIAAVCQKAGLSPTFDEPDVRCTLDGSAFGIAVKRVKSESQLEKHIRKAARQIEGTGIPGHITLDVSLAFNRENVHLVGVDDADLTHTHHITRKKFGDDYFHRIKSWMRGRDVRSVILIDHLVRQHPSDGWGFDSLTYFISLSPDNQRRQREFEQFQARYVSGLATPAAD